MNKRRVVLAMSGGVDSSVAAHLLLSQGYEVIGVFMRHGEEPAACATPSAAPLMDRMAQIDERLPILPGSASSSKQGCCTAADALDARRVADRLGIPFYALNLERDFSRIIDYFVQEYAAGKTPNPCVVCNIWLKFGKLFDYADSVDAHYVATGHYARLEIPPDGELPMLRRGVDDDKDQSYVLFGVEKQRLPRMLLPVGSFQKPEIRRMATQLGMRVADKRDSQEICFVTAGRHAEFVRSKLSDASRGGEIVTTEGQVVGHHPGIEGFTIGQRKGLGVALGEPYFVVSIDPVARRVVIGRKEELACRQLTATRLNWLVDPPASSFSCLAQIRYNSAAQPAQATVQPDGRLDVCFTEPCHGVAPGQAVVCYDGDRVLGGGWIERGDSPSAS